MTECYILTSEGKLIFIIKDGHLVDKFDAILLDKLLPIVTKTFQWNECISRKISILTKEYGHFVIVEYHIRNYDNWTIDFYAEYVIFDFETNELLKL